MAESMSPEPLGGAQEKLLSLGAWGHPLTQHCRCLVDPLKLEAQGSPRSSWHDESCAWPPTRTLFRADKGKRGCLVGHGHCHFILRSLGCSHIRDPEEDTVPNRRNSNIVTGNNRVAQVHVHLMGHVAAVKSVVRSFP